jgi:phage/plasmid-associated DNA primase
MTSKFIKNSNLEEIKTTTTLLKTLSLNSNYTNTYFSRLERIDETKPFWVSYIRAINETDTTYCFNSYDSYEEFKKIQDDTEPSLCRWNEIIRRNYPIVECYDLDGKANDKERNQWMFEYYKEVGEDKIIDDFLNTRKKFIELYYPIYDSKETILISTACTDTKFSIHITVRNKHHFENCYKFGIFAKKFDDYLAHDKIFTLDLQIYSANRSMRMLSNTKYGQDRFLKKYRTSLNFDDKLFLFSYIEPESTLFNVKEDITHKPFIYNNNLSFDKSKNSMTLINLLPIINSDCDGPKWREVAQSIFNLTEGSDKGLEQFIEWSKKDGYIEFNENDCISRWNSLRTNDDWKAIDYLKGKAKFDNPEQYFELTKKKDFYQSEPELIFIDDDIIECGEKIVNNFTHNNLAKIYAEYSKGEIFFTTGYGWIIFDKNTRTWSYNNDKVSLIYPISSFFCNIMKEYSSYFFNKNNDMKLSKQEEEQFLKKIKGMTKMKRDVGNSSFISGVIAQIQSILTKPNDFIDNFDNKPNLFAFSDGKCIDLLNGGKVREIVKEDFIITTTGYAYPERNQVFITKMNHIINSLSDDPEQIKSIKSLLSLGVWGENQNEVFAQLTGSGGNGKGLLDTGMKKVYGKYYQSINSNQLTDYEKDNQRANSELASCRFARVVMATEPEDSKNGKSTTLKVPTLKKWTGRDIITTRFLHKDTFSYTAKFTLMMQLNDLLDLSTNDEAIKRRMKVVELPFKFIKNEGQPLGENEKYRDESLKSLISTDEYRNALFFILLDTWLENNGNFFESEKVKSFTNEFFENQNPVKLWFNQHYEFDRDGKISSTELFNTFKIDDYNSTLSMTAFGRLLKECCKCHKSNGKIVYHCKRKSLLDDDRFNGVPL